jgi:hypothetical protein
VRAPEAQPALDQTCARGYALGHVHEAVRHAFPSGQSGEIGVALSRQDDLRVWDTGRGLPPDLDVAATRSMGLRLVRLFAQRLARTCRWSGSRARASTCPLRWRETPERTGPERPRCQGPTRGAGNRERGSSQAVARSPRPPIGSRRLSGSSSGV